MKPEPQSEDVPIDDAMEIDEDAICEQAADKQAKKEPSESDPEEARRQLNELLERTEALAQGAIADDGTPKLKPTKAERSP